MEEERKFLETNRLILRPWEVKDAKECLLRWIWKETQNNT